MNRTIAPMTLVIVFATVFALGIMPSGSWPCGGALRGPLRSMVKDEELVWR
jgi:hypothetical protein